MRKSTITGVLAASVLALAGCSSGEQPSDLTPGHGTPPPPSAIAPAEDSSDGDETKNVNVDLQFAQQMISHHELGKQLIEVGIKNTQNEEIRSFAERLEAEHGAQVKKVRDWLAQQGKPGSSVQDVGPGEDALMPGTEVEAALTRLEEAQQGRVDELWLDAMITHHEVVVEMATTEIEKGSSKELKAIAEEIRSSREAELEKLKELRENL